MSHFIRGRPWTLYIAEDDFELCSSCLYLPGCWIAAVSHYAWFGQCWESNLGLPQGRLVIHSVLSWSCLSLIAVFGSLWAVPFSCSPHSCFFFYWRDEQSERKSWRSKEKEKNPECQRERGVRSQTRRGIFIPTYLRLPGFQTCTWWRRSLPVCWPATLSSHWSWLHWCSLKFIVSKEQC